MTPLREEVPMLKGMAEVRRKSPVRVLIASSRKILQLRAVDGGNVRDRHGHLHDDVHGCGGYGHVFFPRVGPNATHHHGCSQGSDDDAGKDAQPRIELICKDISGSKQRNQSQQKDAQGMGNRYG